MQNLNQLFIGIFFIYIIFTCAFLINYFYSTAYQAGYFDEMNLNETDY